MEDKDDWCDNEEEERRQQEAESYDGLMNAWEMAGFDS
jgi:hypothetical protein